MTISIHALHEESEPQFISSGTYIIISIHALHEESDAAPHAHKEIFQHFNPRSP